jgi:hypothetical protein
VDFNSSLGEIGAKSPALAANPPALLPARHDLEVEGMTLAYFPAAESIVRDLTLRFREVMHPSGSIHREEQQS